LVDACHARDLALVLDVVYNHLGPEGNYLAEYGPYFTDRYKTPWGNALNFDGPRSDDVRWFFIHNALQWIDEFHVDALRVDAVHALLTGEQAGYYAGFGKVSDLARVLTDGYLYTGQHSPYRGREYGLKPQTRNGAQFVVCAQNHDQVGNRMNGERLAALVPREKLRLAAAAVILSPFIPMLFMGEEYGETAPWQYFTSHGDPDLIEAVRRGRREEFEEFEWEGEPPDP